MAAVAAAATETKSEVWVNQDSNHLRAIFPPKTSPDFLSLGFDCPSHNQAERMAYDMIEFA